MYIELILIQLIFSAVVALLLFIFMFFKGNPF